MAVADRARDFWDRISPRERMLVVLMAVAVPITLAIWLGLSIQDGLVERGPTTTEKDGAKKFKFNIVPKCM